MATREQVEAVREQQYADWKASTNHDAQLEHLAQLQEQQGLEELAELDRLQNKLARPMSRRALVLGNATEDMQGVIVSAISFGTLADQFTTYPEYSTPETEPQIVPPVETRRGVGAVALSHETFRPQSAATPLNERTLLGQAA